MMSFNAPSFDIAYLSNCKNGWITIILLDLTLPQGSRKAAGDDD